MSRTLLEQIATAHTLGEKVDDRVVGQLLKQEGISAEDTVILFKALPRAAAVKHIDTFLAAEEELGSTEVSSLLVSSDFASCGSPTSPEFIRLCQAVLSRLPSDYHTPYADKAHEWRSHVIRNAPKDVDVLVEKSLVYALNCPTVLLFEPLIDEIEGAKAKPTSSSSKLLASYVKETMVDGGGVETHNAFLKKHGADVFQKLSVDAPLHKARVISLCKAAAKTQKLSFDDVQKVMQVSTDGEVEAAIGEATLARLIDVRVNKSQRLIDVQAVVPLRFDKEAWQSLRAHVAKAIEFTNGLASNYGIH